MPKLEHVAIAISDPGVSKLFERLVGRPVYKVENVESENVTTYFINAGSSKLELVSPDNEHSPIHRFLGSRGPGLHHVAFEVNDIDAVYRQASEMGLRLASEAVMDGADGKRVFFVHPSSAGGVLIEFCEASRPVGAAHQATIGGAHRSARTAGLQDADPLLILAPPQNMRVAEQLLAHFEPTHRVTIVETGRQPISFDELHSATLYANALITFGPDGARLLQSAPAEVLPRRSVLFDPPDGLLRSVAVPPGILLIVEKPVEAMSSMALRNSVVLPRNEATASTETLEFVLPLIERHVARGYTGSR